VKAEPLLQESLQVLQSLSPGYHDYLFPPYLNLGRAYSSLGKFSNAESILLELKNVLPPADLTQNMILKISLADLYINVGQYEKAEASIKELLLFAEQKFGNNSQEFARATIIANKYYYTIQDYSRSEEFADKAITIFRKFGGAENPDLPQAL